MSDKPLTGSRLASAYRAAFAATGRKVIEAYSIGGGWFYVRGDMAPSGGGPAPTSFCVFFLLTPPAK